MSESRKATNPRRQEPTGSGCRSLIRLGYTGLAIAFYVLSTGPYAWLADHMQSLAMLDAAELIYAPLIWLADQSDVFESLLIAYLELWVDLFFKPF